MDYKKHQEKRRQYREMVRGYRRQYAKDLRVAGHTYQEIGDILGTSKQEIQYLLLDVK